ncbi:hypothetical protein NDU88_005116 [Pleurodeles waltl]|uniref:Uncharacterized protein n=1 Tax=Pleurodeles waltl TaxID=8319 RepID=A0AAV7NLS8_PLEWA|nr:hypothetical protein NDU88_005116 [Pleurodeles waltl]
MTTDTLPGLSGLDNAPCTPTALSLRLGVHGGIDDFLPRNNFSETAAIKVCNGSDEQKRQARYAMLAIYSPTDPFPDSPYFSAHISSDINFQYCGIVNLTQRDVQQFVTGNPELLHGPLNHHSRHTMGLR